jgi:3D (Asp-Asp-Asp) domain-containing protein
VRHILATVNRPPAATAHLIRRNPTTTATPSSRPEKALCEWSAPAHCDHGTTKSGAHTRDGVVAADSRWLLLGTRLQIVAPGRPHAGIYTVTDTGSKISAGPDIFMPELRPRPNVRTKGHPGPDPEMMV